MNTLQTQPPGLKNFWLTATSSAASSSWSLPYVLLACYLLVEIAFYFLFHYYLIPRANERTAPTQFRDYGNDRHKLLLRILYRIEWMCKKMDRSVQQFITKFLLECFHPVVVESSSASSSKSLQKSSSSPPPPLAKASSESISSSLPGTPSETSSLGGNEDSDTATERSESGTTTPNNGNASTDASNNKDDHTGELWTIPGLGRDDADEFFCWAFFGKVKEDMVPWELLELQECYNAMQKRLGLTFTPASDCGWKLEPRRLSLEDVNPLHRPLLIYLIVLGVKLAAGVLLRAIGYQRIVSEKTGVTGWYRPAKNEATAKLLPMVFFHGIAPGGLVLYLPMVLLGLATDGRAVFLFENDSISCNISFEALTEASTVEGVTELLNRYLEPDAELSLVGHSFGSCQLTWLLHAPALRHRIRQFVLMDPVTILLSDPDVMVNFLYTDSVSKIRMVAASELFTEYYLRRHFSYYNCELWLEDLPDTVKVLVALSEQDEIVNSPKVLQAIRMHAAEHDGVTKDSDDDADDQQDGRDSDSDRMQVIYWEKVGHASCVSSPPKWRDLKQQMLRQELALERNRTPKSPAVVGGSK
jgi:pimeloyl-ACP methyl ester carboxylesterase